MVTLRFTSPALEAMKEYLKSQAEIGALALFVSHAKTRPEYRGTPLTPNAAWRVIQEVARNLGLPHIHPTISVTGGRHGCCERARPSTRSSAISPTEASKPRNFMPRPLSGRLMKLEIERVPHKSVYCLILSRNTFIRSQLVRCISSTDKNSRPGDDLTVQGFR